MAAAALYHTDHVFWPEEAEADAGLRGLAVPALGGDDPWTDASSPNRSVVEYFMANVIIGGGGRTGAQSRWADNKKHALAMIAKLDAPAKKVQLDAWNAWLVDFNAAARGAFGANAPAFSLFKEDVRHTDDDEVRAVYDRLTGEDGIGALAETTVRTIRSVYAKSSYEDQAFSIGRTISNGVIIGNGTPENELTRAVEAAVEYGQHVMRLLMALARATKDDTTRTATARALHASWVKVYTT